MAEWFTVTTATGAIDLDPRRHGAASFVVTNVSGVPLRGRALPFADAPAQADWFTIADGAERSFPSGGSERYEVDVSAPPTAAPGSYRFRLDVLGTDNPDEVQAHGQWVSFQVPVPPKPQPRRVPWPWIIAAAAAAVLLIAGGVTAFVLTHRQGTLSPDPASADFGRVVAGTPATRTVTVRNTGPSATAVTAAIAGPSGPFSLQDDGCARAGKLQPNASCALTVRFAPAARGAATASLQLTGDNAGTRSVALTGTGIAPVTSAPPVRMTIIPFGNASGTAVISNTGDADLHVKQLRVVSNGAIGINQDTCSARAVPAGQSCVIGLFGSVSATPLNGTLTVVSDAVNASLVVPFGQ
jgi:hypothetical protein